ncbi:hypothetical protein CFC21_075043 [Triticum aestivum]|uniref:Uncharacterized protein n=2 Tax=Triticum aestivum TaxID=4565 RepID=A0A9R1HP44_WHEAT|nr:uncharacterized protein LOC119306824 isoform X1 [Triticum dicoccoides]XP_044394423.1 uncharacterized protein LOC123117815 [Triticum aestivum]KAF7069408.1 hypothetical protein CFC21_075043 [Triticum aestivum]
MASRAIIILVSALLFFSVLAVYLPAASRARHAAALNAKDGINSGGRLHRVRVVPSGAVKAGPVTSASGGSGPRMATTEHPDDTDAAAETLRKDYSYRGPRRPGSPLIHAP